MDNSEISIAESNASSSTNRLTSPIHAFTRKARDDELVRDSDHRLIYYCNAPNCSYSAISITTLWKHLKSQHNISKIDTRTKAQRTQEDIQELYKKLLEEGRTTEVHSLSQDIFEQYTDKNIINDTLLNLIIVRRLPLRMIEWQEFHAFCSALNPHAVSWLPTAHSTITQQISKHFKEKKDLVRKVLRSARTKIHLAVDVWTSPNNHLLLGICASFVDNQNHFWNILLALRTIYGHSGQNQWEILLPVLQDFDIEQEIGILIGDNASTNDTLCRTMQEYFTSEYRIEWLASHQRLRCQGHILNLVVHAFLFRTSEDEEEINSYDEEDENMTPFDEYQQKQRGDTIRKKMGLLGKLHNTVIHIRSSPNRTKMFMELAGKRIPLDNRTRWNSWFAMIDCCLEPLIRTTINSYVGQWLQDPLNPFDKRDILSTEEWLQLRIIHTFLAPFEGATKYMQGNRTTLERALESLAILQDHFQEFLKKKLPRWIDTRIRVSYEKFMLYYYRLEESPYYTAARIFDPQVRTTFLKQQDGSWKEDGEKQWKRVEALWKRFVRITITTELRTQQDISRGLRSELDPKTLDAFQQLRLKQKQVGRPKSQDEFENYCFQTVSYELATSSIDWWLEEAQQKQFPPLSTLAIEILAIPGMSDKPERVFSGARRTISWERSRLEVERVERLECVKDWKTAGILDIEI